MKVSHNLRYNVTYVNTVNQQLSGYVLSKVIECLEQKLSKANRLQKTIGNKQMKRVQNNRIETFK